jgi:transposase-like protein
MTLGVVTCPYCRSTEHAPDHFGFTCKACGSVYSGVNLYVASPDVGAARAACPLSASNEDARPAPVDTQ